MFPIKPENIKRAAFATKLFPKIKSSLGLEANKLKTTDVFDGEVFCGGRSKNKDLLTFFGLIAETQRGASTFAQLPLFRRSVKKLIDIVEQELAIIGAHEVLLPTLLPQKLWKQSDRLKRQIDALDYTYNFTDKFGKELLLGPTFEESITQLVHELEPSKEEKLPLLLYQTSNKFRFEPNPRFGLIRTNEFLMNDLYSFDSSLEKAKQTYKKMSQLYEKFFQKIGLDCLRFESQTGSIGGKYSHEYQLSVSSGEDKLIQCNSCGYSYNIEIREEVKNNPDSECLKCKSSNVFEFYALELGHTFLLSDTYSRPMKVTTILDDGAKVHYEMGCYGLGLTRIIGAYIDRYSILPAHDSSGDQNFIQMRWPIGAEPFKIGVVTPAKRSRQHSSGSTDYIERIVNQILDSTGPSTDILIEDRSKEGILRRIFKLQSLGIPNIIVVGQRFLQEQPEVEFLRLKSDRKTYEQNWFSEDQLYNFIETM